MKDFHQTTCENCYGYVENSVVTNTKVKVKISRKIDKIIKEKDTTMLTHFHLGGGDGKFFFTRAKMLLYFTLLDFFQNILYNCMIKKLKGDKNNEMGLYYYNNREFL
ncbi:MAG: hypothetical protein ABIM77_04770 [candidate division WOR-3 bacterium]